MFPNLVLALYKNELVVNAYSTLMQRAQHEKETHSNRICLMIMKFIMEKTIRQSMVDS